MLSLKKEISELRNLLISAVTEFKNAIAAIPKQQHTSSQDMDTENDENSALCTSRQSVLDIQDLVTDLRNDIATFVIETKAMFHHQANLKMPNYPMRQSTT